MTFKKHILSRVTRNNSSWVEQNDYDLENYEEILASITPAEIRDAFRSLVNVDDHLLLSLGDFEL